MKKSLLYKFVLPLMCCVALCGCGDGGLLEEIPRDFAMADPVSGEQSGTGEETRESGELQPEGEARDNGETKSDRENGDAGESEAAAEAESFLREDAFEYARQCLNETERLWYDEMKEILGDFQENVRLSTRALDDGYSEADIDRIFQCVLNDHPELFYVEGYSYTKYTRGERTTAIEFSGTYNVDRETAESRREAIEAAAEEILSGIDVNADQYTRVKYVYDTIIRNTDYELDAPDNQNIYSVFVNHLSVCQGYAKATQYLLNRLGVECTLVLGTVDTGEGHAWNLVKVDGSYYYVDTTWGDASYRIEDGGAERGISMPEINYDYLNVTTEELLKTHSLGVNVPMPACVATEANYYSREGALFSCYDREQMRTLFEGAKEQGREDVTVKCTDEDSYAQVLTALIDEQEIFDYLNGPGSTIAYAQNENQLSLTFWVTNE